MILRSKQESRGTRDRGSAAALTLGCDVGRYGTNLACVPGTPEITTEGGAQASASVREERLVARVRIELTTPRFSEGKGRACEGSQAPHRHVQPHILHCFRYPFCFVSVSWRTRQATQRGIEKRRGNGARADRLAGSSYGGGSDRAKCTPNETPRHARLAGRDSARRIPPMPASTTFASDRVPAPPRLQVPEITFTSRPRYDSPCPCATRREGRR